MTDLELSIKLNGFRIKLDSINELNKLIEYIHDRHLSTETQIDILRDWVTKVKKIHPKIDVHISDLNYFKPISESIASRWKAHTSDTQNVDVTEWNIVKPIRKIVEQKIHNANEITKSYNSLNNGMSRNLPKEFTNRAVDGPVSDDYIISDTSYIEFLKGDNLINVINTTLQTVLGDAERLINYIHPVSSSIIIEDNIVTISIESNDVQVNKIGDKKYVIASKIDDSILIPVVDI